MDPQRQAKAHQAAADLDAARCQGNWAAIPDLAKRYKKYHPNETVLEAIARLEAEYAILVNFVRQGETETPESQETPSSSNVKTAGRKSVTNLSLAHTPFELTWSDTHHANDDPHRIAFDPYLSIAQAEYLLKQIQDIITRQHDSSSDLDSTDDWQAQLAKIIAARIFLETDRPRRAFDMLQNLALRMDDVRSGYGLVLLVQARIIKGMCLEQEDDISAALEAYDGAWDAIDRNAEGKGEIMTHWIEQGLYRSVLLRLRARSQVKHTLKAMRAYMQMASSQWPASWRMHKRWVVFRHYAQYLTKVCKQPGAYYPMTMTTPADGDSPKSKHKTTPYEEMKLLFSQFMNLYSKILPELDDKLKTLFTLELIKLMLNAYDVVGWGEISNMRRILEFLRNAQKYTFNNVLIARYMFLTLVRTGAFEEAKHAFRNYMGLVGLPDVDKTEETGVETTPRHNMSVAEKASMILDRLSAMRHAKKEKEKDIAVAKALLAGIILYGQELDQQTLAVSLCDILIELSGQTHGQAKDWDPVVKEGYRLRGVSYGVLASNCNDPDKRSTYLHKSVASLEDAVKVDDSCWRSYYELAVQQAQMRDMVNATKSIGRSLQLNPKHLGSWYLLALIYSCNNVAQGLQTIQTGLRDCPLDIPTNLHSDYPVIALNPTENKNARDCFTQAECFLKMRMAQISFLEKLEGPTAVMKLYNDLFSTFAKLSQNLGINLTTLLEKSQKLTEETVVSQRSSFTTRTSRSKSVTSSLSADRRGSRRNTDFDWEALGLERPPPLPKSQRGSISEDARSSHVSLALSVPSVPSTSSMPSVPPLKPSKSQGKLRKKSLGLIGKLSRSSNNLSSKAKLEPIPSQTSVFTNANPSIVTIKKEDTESLAPTSEKPPQINTLEHQDTSSTLVSVLTADSFTTLTSEVVKKPTVDNTFTTRQQQRWLSHLVQLWVMSAATYLRADRIEEATKAVYEAESLGPNNANVWHVMGKLCRQQSETKDEMKELGLEAFKKALAFDSHHVAAHVDLASAYIQMEEYELAEGLLNQVTKGTGWDSAEAWYLLGTVHKHLKSTDEAKDCLLYALQLSETTPLTPFKELPRFI